MMAASWQASPESWFHLIDELLPAAANTASHISIYGVMSGMAIMASA